MCYKQVLFFIIALSLGPVGIEAGEIEHRVEQVIPSTVQRVKSDPELTRIYIACYGRTWFEFRKPLNCSFTLWLSRPENADNGGHFHNEDTRPLIYRKRRFVQGSHGAKPVYEGPGSLEFVFDTDPANDRVSGGTINAGGAMTSALIHYPLPEVSGEVQIDVQVTLPEGWHFNNPNSYRRNMHWKRYLLDIGVSGLVPVPDPGPEERYIKVRTYETEHPDSVAFHIRSEYMNSLRNLAKEYYLLSKEQRALSLNDISLPKGGIFDVKADWEPPHRSHRDGTDADINQGGIPCQDDTNLIKSARRALPNLRDKFGTGGNTDSAVWCESGGRKHVDFER